MAGDSGGDVAQVLAAPIPELPLIGDSLSSKFHWISSLFSTHRFLPTCPAQSLCSQALRTQERYSGSSSQAITHDKCVGSLGLVSMPGCVTLRLHVSSSLMKWLLSFMSSGPLLLRPVGWTLKSKPSAERTLRKKSTKGTVILLFCQPCGIHHRHLSHY